MERGDRLSGSAAGTPSTPPDLVRGGTAHLTARADVLTGAPDEKSLERVEQVLGSHPERRGQRNERIVTWVGDPAAS